MKIYSEYREMKRFAKLSLIHKTVLKTLPHLPLESPLRSTYMQQSQKAGNITEVRLALIGVLLQLNCKKIPLEKKFHIYQSMVHTLSSMGRLTEYVTTLKLEKVIVDKFPLSERPLYLEKYLEDLRRHNPHKALKTIDILDRQGRERKKLEHKIHGLFFGVMAILGALFPIGRLILFPSFIAAHSFKVPIRVYSWLNS